MKSYWDQLFSLGQAPALALASVPGIILAILAFVLFIQPKLQRQSEPEARKIQLLRQYQQSELSVIKIRKDLLHAQTKVHEFEKKLQPALRSSPTLFAEKLSEQARNAGLEHFSLDPSEQQAALGYQSSHSVLQAYGRYEAIHQFVQAMLELPFILKIQKLELHQRASEQQIQLQLLIEHYHLGIGNKNAKS